MSPDADFHLRHEEIHILLPGPLPGRKMGIVRAVGEQPAWRRGGVPAREHCQFVNAATRHLDRAT